MLQNILTEEGRKRSAELWAELIKINQKTVLKQQHRVIDTAASKKMLIAEMKEAWHEKWDTYRKFEEDKISEMRINNSKKSVMKLPE